MSTSESTEPPADELEGALDQLEVRLLGETPSLTRVEVAEQAGVTVGVAEELWRLLGFAHASDEDRAFTPADVEALRYSHDLMQLGILSPERQAALVRTWGRSFARLAEWQTTLLASVALDGDGDPVETLGRLSEEVLPRVEALQSYVWRRHLASAGSRMLGLAPGSKDADGDEQAVVFADIVGYTSRSKELSESELVGWLEHFESRSLEVAGEHGGRIIKNIGDEVLLVADDVHEAVAIALRLTDLGEDADDPFPQVRAGVAYGEVVSRLGDVYGPTVNLAARLTSVARPGTVVVDEGVHDVLAPHRARSGEHDHDRQQEGRGEPDRDDDRSPYRLRRIRRVSVKDYSHTRAWAVRRREPAD